MTRKRQYIILPSYKGNIKEFKYLYDHWDYVHGEDIINIKIPEQVDGDMVYWSQQLTELLTLFKNKQIFENDVIIMESPTKEQIVNLRQFFGNTFIIASLIKNRYADLHLIFDKLPIIHEEWDYNVDNKTDTILFITDKKDEKFRFDMFRHLENKFPKYEFVETKNFNRQELIAIFRNSKLVFALENGLKHQFHRLYTDAQIMGCLPICIGSKNNLGWNILKINHAYIPSLSKTKKLWQRVNLIFKMITKFEMMVSTLMEDYCLHGIQSALTAEKTYHNKYITIEQFKYKIECQLQTIGGQKNIDQKR